MQLSESKDHSGVVVWLEPIAGKPPRNAAADRDHGAPAQDIRAPRAGGLRTGSKVRFPNLDPFFHNAFSNYDGQMFDIGLHPPGFVARGRPFTGPGIVRLFCNIHPTMSAVIVVLDTPWFAVSDVQGAFRIAGVPPGEYRLQVFLRARAAGRTGKA